MAQEQHIYTGTMLILLMINYSISFMCLVCTSKFEGSHIYYTVHVRIKSTAVSAIRQNIAHKSARQTIIAQGKAECYISS